MEITGVLGACKGGKVRTRTPAQDTKVQYAKNDNLRMCVMSVDGVNYVKLHAKSDRTRSFYVGDLFKIKAGGEIYEVV